MPQRKSSKEMGQFGKKLTGVTCGARTSGCLSTRQVPGSLIPQDLGICPGVDPGFSEEGSENLKKGVWSVALEATARDLYC